MTFPQFFSSLIIACSTFSVLLFGVLTYADKEYCSKWLNGFLILSIFFITLTNISLVITFYQSEIIVGSDYAYPLFTYILGMIMFTLGGIYLILGRYAKIFDSKNKC